MDHCTKAYHKFTLLTSDDMTLLTGCRNLVLAAFIFVDFMAVFDKSDELTQQILLSSSVTANENAEFLVLFLCINKYSYLMAYQCAG